MSSYGNSGGMGGVPLTSPLLDQAQSRLQQTEANHSFLTQQLQRAMTEQRAASPMSQMSDAKAEEIKSLHRQLRQREREMEEYKRTIRQQQATILTQSQTIANPRQHFYSTPIRAPHQPDANSPYGQTSARSHRMLPPPPPPYHQVGHPHPGNRDLPSIYDNEQLAVRASHPRHHAYQTPLWNTPMPAQPQPPFQQHALCGSVNPFGSPEPPRSQQMVLARQTTAPVTPIRATQAHTNSQAPTTHSGSRTRASGPGSAQPSNASSPMVPITHDQEILQVKDLFEKLFTKALQYTHAHINSPSTQRDEALPQAIKTLLIESAAGSVGSHAFHFMQTPFTRYMLVTKVMATWLIKNVFTPECFNGLDSSIDRAISTARGQIYQSTPPQIKYQLLMTINQNMVKLRQHDNFKSYLSHLAKSRGNELWPIIKPLMYGKSSRDWEDLFTLLQEAHEVAWHMYSGSAEYRFDWLQPGLPFSRHTMICRDPYTERIPVEEIESRNPILRLCFLPAVTVRSCSVNGQVASSNLVQAQVLLRM